MMDVVFCIPTIQSGIQARNAYMVKFLMANQTLKKIKILMLIFVVIIFLVIVDVESSL